MSVLREGRASNSPTRLTKVQSRQLHAHEAATRGFGTELSLNDRNSRVHKAHANAADYASHEHVWYVVSSRLQQSTWMSSAQGCLDVMHGAQTNDENDYTYQHRPASTEPFTYKRCSDGANEAANLCSSQYSVSKILWICKLVSKTTLLVLPLRGLYGV